MYIHPVGKQQDFFEADSPLGESNLVLLIRQLLNLVSPSQNLS